MRSVTTPGTHLYPLRRGRILLLMPSLRFSFPSSHPACFQLLSFPSVLRRDISHSSASPTFLRNDSRVLAICYLFCNNEHSLIALLRIERASYPNMPNQLFSLSSFSRTASVRRTQFRVTLQPPVIAQFENSLWLSVLTTRHQTSVLFRFFSNSITIFSTAAPSTLDDGS